jgi:hypothetical protein
MKKSPVSKFVLTPVKSSAIKAHGYDEKRRVLRIQFHTGHVYDFSGVDSDKHAAFAGAESFGKHFMQHIRGAHKSTRIFTA